MGRITEAIKDFWHDWLGNVTDQDVKASRLRYNTMYVLFVSVIILPLASAVYALLYNSVACLDSGNFYPETTQGLAACTSECALACYNPTNDQTNSILAMIIVLILLALVSGAAYFVVSNPKNVVFPTWLTILTFVVEVCGSASLVVTGSILLHMANQASSADSDSVIRGRMQVAGSLSIVFGITLVYPASQNLLLYFAKKELKARGGAYAKV